MKSRFYSDLDNGKDFYDGQVDITHASDYVSVTNNYFHDHFKVSLGTLALSQIIRVLMLLVHSWSFG